MGNWIYPCKLVDMKDIIKKYDNDKITLIWEPGLCAM
jgi:hypothetical protein